MTESPKFEERLDAADGVDTEGCMRLAHSLKGAAGTLGMGAIFSAAETLEIACRRGADEPTLRSHARRLGALVRQMVEDLAAILPEPPAAS